jgi:hypothetical protein
MTNQIQNKLFETTVDIDPVAVVYNVQNDDIENFVYNYLTNARNIDGVAAVRVHVVRDGNKNPEVSLYLFLDMSSSDVFSNLKNVPEHLRNKMDVGGFRASEKLFNALKPIVKDFKLSADPKEKLVYTKLDIFKVLGLMLAAERGKHNIVVSEVVKLKKKRSILTVIKSNKFIDKDEASFDKYASIIESEED